MGSFQPVCVPCGAVMLCSKTGRRVIEVASDGEQIRIHTGDEFACPECGTRVVQGYGNRPIAESWQGPVFEALVNDGVLLEHNPYRRYVKARHTRAPLPEDPDVIDPAPGAPTVPDSTAWWRETAQALARVAREAKAEADAAREQLREAGLLEKDPREKGDDDGQEYGDPRDEIDDRLRRDL